MSKEALEVVEIEPVAGESALVPVPAIHAVPVTRDPLFLPAVGRLDRDIPVSDESVAVDLNDFEWMENPKKLKKPKRTDLLDVLNAFVLGAGGPTELAYVNLQGTGVEHPAWGAASGVFALITTTIPAINMINPKWREQHPVAMRVNKHITTIIKVGARLAFNGGFLIQVLPVDLSWESRLRNLSIAGVMTIPFMILEHGHIRKGVVTVVGKAFFCCRGDAPSCFSHPFWTKIAEAINQAFAVNGDVGGAFSLLVIFGHINSQTSLITAGVAGAVTGLLALLPEDKLRLIDGAKLVSSFARPTFATFALGSAVMKLIFSIASGISSNREFPDAVGYGFGIPLAVVFIVALIMRVVHMVNDHREPQAVQLLEPPVASRPSFFRKLPAPTDTTPLLAAVAVEPLRDDAEKSTKFKPE